MSAASEHCPRWRRRPSERPSEILAAALDVFAERGLAGARVEDIGRRAGVSKGTVYLYFPSKEDLFREAVREKMSELMEGLSSAVGSGDPVERLVRFIDAYWEHLCRPHFGSMYRLLLAELHHFPEIARFFAEEVSGEVIQLSARVIQQGMKSGQFRPVDPEVASRMIVGLLVQHAVWRSHPKLFIHLKNRTDDVVATEVKEFLLSALLAPGVTAPALA